MKTTDVDIWINTQIRGWQNFSIKGLTVNIFSFVGHSLSKLFKSAPVVAAVMPK